MNTRSIQQATFTLNFGRLIVIFRPNIFDTQIGTYILHMALWHSMSCITGIDLSTLLQISYSLPALV